MKTFLRQHVINYVVEYILKKLNFRKSVIMYNQFYDTHTDGYRKKQVRVLSHYKFYNFFRILNRKVETIFEISEIEQNLTFHYKLSDFQMTVGRATDSWRALFPKSKLHSQTLKRVIQKVAPPTYLKEILQKQHEKLLVFVTRCLVGSRVW